jgi:hypothetical protein
LNNLQDDDRRDDGWGGRRNDRWDDRRRGDDSGGPISNTIEATKEKLSYAKNKAEGEASRLKQKAEETAGARLHKAGRGATHVVRDPFSTS